MTIAAQQYSSRLLLWAAVFFCGPLLAEVREVTGEFLYGPNMSESQACEAAEQRAKQEALRQVLGERFSTNQQLSCREGAAGVDDTECVYNTFLWTEIDGDITQATRIGQPVVDRQMGGARCTVRMQVAVDVPTQQPDPNFDFQASLSSIRLRSKEAVSFVIQPSATMHLAIFGWAPAQDKEKVVLIFPNIYDTKGLLAAKVNQAIPTAEGQRRYQFNVTFPAGVKQDFVDEYLIFVATKTPIAWLDQYEFEQFRSRLREISPPQKRVVKHSYRIIR
jgi:hypothetical protein